MPSLVKGLRSKLGQRIPARRPMLLRQQVTQLLMHGRIETTRAKAKALRRVADVVITLAKKSIFERMRGNIGRALGLYRAIDKIVLPNLRPIGVAEKPAVTKLFEEHVERYLERHGGGYTRVLKSRTRVGDAAPMAFGTCLECVCTHG